MLTLPRGAFNGHENVRLASAEWASPQEVERFPYRGKGGLFFGAMPYQDAWPKLTEFWQKVGELRGVIETRSSSPIERADSLAALEAIWLKALNADCMPVGFDDDRHVMTIAGARSGKGQSTIIPTLCFYPGSVVCLDPKGENATLTAARRGQGDEGWCEGLGQEVYVLDPFGVADVPDALRASMNPLALLDPTSPLVVDDAALLAEGLVLPGGTDDGHWTETARNLVKGVILHLVSIKPNATLFDLRRYLAIGDVAGFRAALAKKKEAEKAREEDPDLPDPKRILPDKVRSAFMFLLWQMERNQAFGGVIAGTAESILGTGENERGSILSTARRNTAFLDTLGPRYKATLSGDFRPLDPNLLKASPKGVTVYLCLPAERMGTHGRWLRLMIGLMLERMQRQLIQPASDAPVLFLLEEFFALGTMPAIEKAAGYAAGFGVKLFVVLQDLQQLKALYKSSWQTFLANAGAVQIFGASDRETLEYAAKSLGEFEVTRVTTSITSNTSEGESQGSTLGRFGPGLGGSRQGMGLSWLFRAVLPDKSRSSNSATTEGQSVGLHIVPLLRPDEIAMQFARESGAMLLLIKGQRPMWILRVNYNESPWFQGTFTPLNRWKDKHQKSLQPKPFWGRSEYAFHDVVAEFNHLASQMAR